MENKKKTANLFYYSTYDLRLHTTTKNKIDGVRLMEIYGRYYSLQQYTIALRFVQQFRISCKTQINIKIGNTK